MCLAFESLDVGQQMLAWATKFCLFPDDEVYIVHCLSKVLHRALHLCVLQCMFHVPGICYSRAPLVCFMRPTADLTPPISSIKEFFGNVATLGERKGDNVPISPSCQGCGSHMNDGSTLHVQSLLKLANKKGNEVGPEIVEDIESEQVNVVSNTQLKVR